MQVFRGTAGYCHGPCNLTIGNFDGLHLGHLAILEQLKSMSRQNNLPTVVMTFEPHPREYFTPASAPARLTSLREKLELLQQAGIDYVIVMPFNQRLAQLSAEEFISWILVRDLQAKCILVGDDFCFGAKRTGNFETLKAAGTRHGFLVASHPTVSQGDKRISSTAIRQSLSNGHLEEAQALLGRPYSMSGHVIHGDKLGRVLGYPTANIHFKHKIPPLMGIFCVEIHGLDKPYQGAASLGVRPTVKQNAPPTLEVFIFDFQAQIYHRHVRVVFLKKLRDEVQFPDIISMTQQIERDVENTKAFFAQRHKPHTTD